MVNKPGLWLSSLAAIVCCSLAAQNAPARDVQAIFARGEQALAHKQYPEAEEDFTRLLRMGLRTAPVYSNLGVVYLHSGKPDEAIRMLTSAERLAPAVAGIRLNLGLVYFHQREFKRASRYFGEVLSLEPDQVQARYLLGICAFMIDDFSAAVATFEPIYARQSGDLEYLFMLGISYGMLKQMEKSQRTFAALVTAGGDTPHLHLLLGKAFLGLGEYHDADRELNVAARDETLPYTHYYLGVLARQQNQIERASQEFEKEVALVPANAWAIKELATIKADQGDPQEAVKLLQSGISNNPLAPELYAALGKIYLQAHEAEKAQPLLQRAISLDPQNSAFHFELARAYRAQGMTARADQEMARTRALADGSPIGQMQRLSLGSVVTRVP